MPSAAMRPSRFLAPARPALRRISTAWSSLPSASVSAFLHSIIPAPVFSRRAFTISAVIAAMTSFVLHFGFDWLLQFVLIRNPKSNHKIG